jgi:hypothetical protein
MKYANLHGYTDINPYEVVQVVSDKTLKIRPMKSKLDPNWKPKMIPGGFAAHCTNQNDQTYTYSSYEQAETIRCRKRKDGHWYSAYGRHVLSETPLRFYDYNF